VSLIALLKRMAEGSQARIALVDAPSSLDAMMVALDRDPLERGTAILDANRLLLFDFDLDATLDYYIYHVCSVAHATVHRVVPSTENRLDLLQTKLLRHFQPTHPAKLVRMDRAKHSVLELTVGTLRRARPSVTYNTTLFIPGKPARAADQAFLQMLLA
jgi:hypothetical protein